MTNIAIFASGSGSNAENIVKIFHQGNRLRVAVVLVNKKEAGVRDRMARLGVPTVYVPNSVWADEPEKVVEILKPYDIELIVLAGFLREVKPAILQAYAGRIINIHPSLLPKHGGPGMYGMRVHEAVVAAGDTKSGATVHFVSEQIDGGEIIMQQEVELTADDTPESVAEKVHGVEYSLFPRAIVAALQRLSRDDEEGNAPAVPDAPAVPEAPEVPAPAPEVPDAPEVPEQITQGGASIDEEWAGVLRVKYSDREAAEAARRAVPPAPAAPAISQPAPPATPQPRSYMWLSILMTLLCCTPLGIVAIVYSAQVSSRASVGDMQGADRASRKAQIWIIASFVLGLLWATLIYPIYIFGSMLF